MPSSTVLPESNVEPLSARITEMTPFDGDVKDTEYLLENTAVNEADSAPVYVNGFSVNVSPFEIQWTK